MYFLLCLWNITYANFYINWTVSITIWLPLQDFSFSLSFLSFVSFDFTVDGSFLSPTNCINEESPITKTEQLFACSDMTMEERLTKMTTLCYHQNVYLTTFVTLYLLFFLCLFCLYSTAIRDLYIEYKAYREHLCSTEHNKGTKNTPAIRYYFGSNNNNISKFCL